MYEWLTERIEQAKKIFEEFSLDWAFLLNEPANETSIRACELELGVTLPPSYRSFLLQYNGAHLFCTEDRERSLSSPWWADSGLFIQGTDTLLLWNQAEREDYDLEKWDSLLPFCYLGRIGTGDFCALDPQQHEDSEYAVLDCDHELVASEWRKARIAYYERGNVHFAQGNYQEAIEDYNQVFLLNPQSVIAYNKRGLARFELRDYQGALEDYNQALQLNSSFIEAYVNRGNLRSRLGESLGALEDRQKADALGSIAIVEEIELESKVTSILTQGQEAIMDNSNDFFESDDNLTFSDE